MGVYVKYKPCPSNCIECKNSTTCTRCDISIEIYYLISGYCITKCPEGFFMINIDNLNY
jgi:hypothetical protein